MELVRNTFYHSVSIYDIYTFEIEMLLLQVGMQIDYAD